MGAVTLGRRGRLASAQSIISLAVTVSDRLLRSVNMIVYRVEDDFDSPLGNLLVSHLTLYDATWPL